MAWFSGKDAALEQAIDADNAAGVQSSVRAGADVNARGRVGVTPLEYAIGHFKLHAYQALLSLKANPNQRDNEGDNAMTLARRAFRKDPSYLKLALEAGGDPNTRDTSNDPIMENFFPHSNIVGIKLLYQHGADLNAVDRNQAPLVILATENQYWTSAWTLLQLGARYDYNGVRGNIGSGFQNTEVLDPKGTYFADRRRCWQFLHSKGVKLPPLQEPLR